MNNLMRYRTAGGLAIPASGKLLYLVLLDVIGDRNEVVISQRRIGEILGMNRKTVSRNLRRLQEGGYIAIEETHSEYGGRMPNRYYVL
jgi:DNA-binding MarR family transcriptional regulator